MTIAHAGRADLSAVDSTYAWIRLFVALVLGTIGSVGMWSYVVALPPVQAEFGVARADASLPYTLAMIGFGVRRRRAWAGSPTASASCCRRSLGALLLGVGFVAAGYRAEHLAASSLAHVADRRRQLGDLRAADRRHLALVQAPARHRGRRSASCGNYLGRRDLAADRPALHRGRRLAPDLHRHRRLLPRHHAAARADAAPAARRSSTSTLGGAARGARHARPARPTRCRRCSAIAGVACCVAMSMPQVHIVAYCGDLGYGAARGAEMLSLMLGFGIVSRLASGCIADRIGGLRTLLLGSVAAGRRAAALPAASTG